MTIEGDPTAATVCLLLDLSNVVWFTCYVCINSHTGTHTHTHTHHTAGVGMLVMFRNILVQFSPPVEFTLGHFVQNANILSGQKRK